MLLVWAGAILGDAALRLVAVLYRRLAGDLPGDQGIWGHPHRVLVAAGALEHLRLVAEHEQLDVPCSALATAGSEETTDQEVEEREAAWGPFACGRSHATRAANPESR